MHFFKAQNSTPKCYAYHLGGCSEKLTREHVFTNAIFPGNSPIGFSGNSKIPNLFIGKGSATAKILCKTHNERLSQLDSEAKKLSDALDVFHSTNGKFHVNIDGLLLERWLLKVTIGHLAAGYTHFGVMYPEKILVQALFGLAKFDTRLGLYTITPVNRNSDRTHELLFREITAVHNEHGECIFGAFIALHGCPFLLELGGPFPIQDYLVKPDGQSYLDPYDTTRAQAKNRPKSLTMSNFDYSREIIINFEWK